MPDNIAVKNVKVADPEIAFNIQLDRPQIAQKFSSISFYLTITQKRPNEDRDFKSEMHIARTIAHDSLIREEVINDEFDIIFPFVDPHYAYGQTFNYKLEIALWDMEGEIFYTQTVSGEEHIASDGKYLNYWIQNGKLEYAYLDKTFEKPTDGTLKVFDAVMGKAGMGIRISWGDDLKPRVRKIQLIADFEDGKAMINTWLNVDMKYIPKYLPLTIFAPYPKGIGHDENFTPSTPRSFSVKLCDEKDMEVGVVIDSNIPWSKGQRLPS